MEEARRILRPRREDAHKGDFGHALLVCGSCGMAGAAVLATMGALRSGCGLVTVHLPESERMAIHVTSPSAMVDSDPGARVWTNTRQWDAVVDSGGILRQRRLCRHCSKRGIGRWFWMRMP